MSSFFTNKVIAITGGSEGIGKALIDALVPFGARIATCGRNYDKLYNLQMEYANVMMHTVVADVSKEDDCRKFIESTIDTFGDIDILINNAGVSMRALFEDAEIEVFRKVMDVNFFGAVYCTKFALPSLIRKQGVVVGISSIAGYRGLPGRSAYSASKFALQGWLEALRTEMLDKQVHVMWVSPGFTTSNIRVAALNAKAEAIGSTSMDEASMMPASECADHILHAIEKRKRSEVLTFTDKRTVFMSRFFPSWADKLTHKFFFKDGKLVK
ncbi:SDR family oxidoreductase [Flavihumibacter petaseus]|uniref:Putative oxidoreductase n=1 Tax=Flavihumibacter petaseus NBRC 106054 TaxID=1220578 RepID=A0A0E9N1U6_9BACT|nr:SDR family oxidoreductase [Flavihumibacter petaseus]GAO43748.1 putative oxidoreductase [Flavihumibacter petaseus NBRC 106054]